MPMRPRTCALALAGLVIASAAPALAQPAGVPVAPPPPPPPPPAERPLPSFALTFSPVHLALPIVELTGELRVHRKVGVAGIVGAGTVELSNSDASATVFELGVSGRYYALGDFRTGLQVGGELLYLGANAEDGQTTATATGLGIGGFVGYKWTAGFGLTLEAQVGASTYVVRAESNSGDTDEDSAAGVLLNLNVGYSF